MPAYNDDDRSSSRDSVSAAPISRSSDCCDGSLTSLLLLLLLPNLSSEEEDDDDELSLLAEEEDPLRLFSGAYVEKKLLPRLKVEDSEDVVLLRWLRRPELGKAVVVLLLVKESMLVVFGLELLLVREDSLDGWTFW